MGGGTVDLHDRVALVTGAGSGIGAASVRVTLGNDGTRLGKPGLTVAVSGPNGYQRTVVRALDTILPGDTIAYPLAWPDVLQPGDYSIVATATAPDTVSCRSLRMLARNCDSWACASNIGPCGVRVPSP